MFTTENLTFWYPGSKKPALHQVNLSIPAGSITGITGASGAGKTTLLYCLANIAPLLTGGRLSGSVKLAGQPLHRLSREELMSRIGLVLADAECQLFAATVEEEITLSLQLLPWPEKLKQQRLQEVLQRMDLLPLCHRSPHTLSGGQKQRLALAAALARQPAVLLLDEPTAELDPRGSRETFVYLQELNKREGITIVIAEQKTDLLAAFCDHLIVLQQGRVYLSGEPRHVFAQVEKIKAACLPMPAAARVVAALVHQPPPELPLTAEECVRWLAAWREERGGS